MTVRWVTFDCYGTLIDWERGVVEALRPLLPHAEAESLARRYIEIEAGIESGAYLPYRDVLTRAGDALLRELGVEAPSPLAGSLASWPPFAEVSATLRVLRERGLRFAILSNVDRDLLEASVGALGIAPDLAITAQDCGSYKPAPGHWLLFQRRSGAPVEETLHVGASQYHDMRPAAALGYRTCFVDRHNEPLVTEPTLVLPDLAGLPDAIARL